MKPKFKRGDLVEHSKYGKCEVFEYSSILDAVDIMPIDDQWGNKFIIVKADELKLLHRTP